MDLLILDKNYDTLCVVDTFTSLIWTERYRSYGDFELYMPVETPYFPFIELGNYVMLDGSDDVMIIEDIEIKSDAENGNYITVSGRSLESILDRRIVWSATVLSGNFQNEYGKLLNAAIISPSNSRRKIKGFAYKKSTDSRITRLTVEASYLGESLYSITEGLCVEKDIGFRIKPALDEGGFEFEFYCGEDRSYDQDDNPWVVFSPNYDNLTSSDFYTSSQILKTDALVAGQDDVVVSVGDGSNASGLDRREAYVESSGGQPTITYEYYDEETGITSHVTVQNPEYKNQLVDVGKEYLSNCQDDTMFDGVVDSNRQYILGKDFFIGDIVQIVNEYGMEARSRITEIVRSQDDSGEFITPTFTSIV